MEPGGTEALFTLRLDGTTVGDAVATLCVEGDSTLLYVDQWRAWWWWHGPGITQPENGDSTVRAVASSFFNDAAFGVLESAPGLEDWVDNPAFDKRAAVAAHLKQDAYRRNQRLTSGTPIPEGAKDSVRTLSVDSGLVLRIVSSMERDKATTFAYWQGEENGVVIAWWREGQQFVTVQRP